MTSRNRLPEIVLHIGLAKTGTTSIQNFCKANRGSLLDHGVLYPETGCLGPGHQLFALGMLDGIRKDLQSAQHPELPELLSQAMGEVEAADGQIDKVVLSSERFANATDDEATYLKDHLRNFNVRVVLFLRRQDSLAESMFAQAMRVRWTHFSKEKLLNPRNPRFRFHTLIRRWQKAFGSKAVRVCRFGYPPESGGDLIDQFLTAIDAQDSRTDRRDFRSNTKLSRDALEFLFHHTDLEFASAEYNRVDSHLVEYSRLNPTPSEFRNFFSPAERKQILANHADENALVAKQFFDTDQLFPEPEICSDSWQDYPGLSPSAVAEIKSFLNRAKAA